MVLHMLICFYSSVDCEISWGGAWEIGTIWLHRKYKQCWTRTTNSSVYNDHLPRQLSNYLASAACKPGWEYKPLKNTMSGNLAVSFYVSTAALCCVLLILRPPAQIFSRFQDEKQDISLLWPYFFINTQPNSFPSELTYRATTICCDHVC